MQVRLNTRLNRSTSFNHQERPGPIGLHPVDSEVSGNGPPGTRGRLGKESQIRGYVLGSGSLLGRSSMNLVGKGRPGVSRPAGELVSVVTLECSPAAGFFY